MVWEVRPNGCAVGRRHGHGHGHAAAPIRWSAGSGSVCVSVWQRQTVLRVVLRTSMRHRLRCFASPPHTHFLSRSLCMQVSLIPWARTCVHACLLHHACSGNWRLDPMDKLVRRASGVGSSLRSPVARRRVGQYLRAIIQRVQ